MPLRCLALVLAAACSSPRAVPAVAPPAAPTPAAPPAAEDTSFPGGWLGVWRGPLQIDIAGKPPTTMAMELHIQPLDAPGRWTFRLVYNGEPRDYVLIAVDPTKGLYQVDEQSSIVVDARLAGDTLLSQLTRRQIQRPHPIHNHEPDERLHPTGMQADPYQPSRIQTINIHNQMKSASSTLDPIQDPHPGHF